MGHSKLSKFNLLSFILLLRVSNSPNEARISDDQVSLLAFKSKVTSDPHHALQSWNSSNPLVCDWPHVKCDAKKTAVTKLTLRYKSLVGTISPFIFNLSRLSRLDLCGNFFEGLIPSEIGSLPSLEYLNLPFNSLQGEIPVGLGYLPRLMYVNLASNKFTGEIPVQLLCNTSSLLYLELAKNSLVGEIPIGNQCEARELRYLVLWSNRLVGKVPLSLSNSSKLEWLDLGQNLFTGELPSELLSNLHSLNYLYLSSNHFYSHDNNTNLEPFFASFLNTSYLKGIELSGCHLGGELPSVLGDLSSLEEVLLDSNLIHGPIPTSISNLVNLTLLNLSSNLLTGSVPTELYRMGKMERIHLSRNSLSGCIPSEVGKMPRLGLLDLSKNNLSGAIPDSFSNLIQLRKLFLNENDLSGTIPTSLGKCVNLEVLDLSHNRISGVIPSEVAILNSLKVYLNLSGNLLHGHIPSELGKMNMVLAIDLSSNNLSSTVPSQLGSCVALEFLNLSRNQLEGKFPESIGSLPFLKELDLSFNRLTGEIPQSLQKSSSLKVMNFSYNNFYGNITDEGLFSSLTKNSFLGNKRLCGPFEGLRKCHGKHTHHFFMSIFLSLLITPIFCIAGYSLVCGSKFKRRFLVLNNNKAFMDDEKDSKEELKYPRISHRQLIEATGGFSSSSLIGSGRYGHVYKGVLRDDKEIAVKVLHSKAAGGGEISGSFKRECQVLRRIRHRNLIRIVSTCSRPDFKAIVLPLMPKGSLENHLYPIHEQKDGLDLVQLVGICSDVAEGMAYLHHYAPVKVVHCDLKPSNILLDDDLTAVVTDFGISRLVRDEQSSSVGNSVSYDSTKGLLCGTVGYIAPEYGMGSNASTQGDVYSFGVVLMEIVTGKRPTDVLFQEGSSMHEWVKRRFPDKLDSIIQEAMVRRGQVGAEAYDNETWGSIIMELVELGLICTQYSPGNRPTMMDVAREITLLKEYLCTCSDSKNKHQAN